MAKKKTLEVGDIAPDFKVATIIGKSGKEGEFSLSEMRGKKVVLFFYPKDMTSGCTKEACDFRDHEAAFKKAGAVVLGVSKDSLDSHRKFREKESLDFDLGSDPEGKVLESYGVWVEKSMYGRKYMGIERSTFLIDEQGRLEAVWRKVKVPDHVSTVLSLVRGSK